MRLTYHIFRFLERRGYYICRSYKRPRNAGNPLQLGFAALLSSGASPVYCVQIGAADGVSNDPLRPILASQEGRVKAVLVEPQPGYAASLRELYQNSNSVEIFEVAVARESGTLELHLPKDPKDAQKASLNADQRKKFPTVEFETIPVRAVTVRELLEGAKFERVDLLQIDAEGLDYEILSQFFESGIFQRIARCMVLLLCGHKPFDDHLGKALLHQGLAHVIVHARF